MCQEESPKSGVRIEQNRLAAFGAAILTPVFCLLTPFDLVEWPKSANYRLDFHDCHPLP